MKKAVRVHPGERVYVTGNTPSGLPRDRTVTFRYDKDGEPVIHSFTVLDAYVFGDFGGGMGIGDIIKSLDPPPGGLQLPVGGPQRQVNLQPYAFLPGKMLVTLGGTPGAIRLNIPYNNTKLEYGQVLTNPPPIATYAEALAPGAASIDIAFQGEDVATNYTCSFSLPVTVSKLNQGFVTGGDYSVTNLPSSTFRGAFQPNSNPPALVQPDFINAIADRFQVWVDDKRRTEATITANLCWGSNVSGLPLYRQPDGRYVSTNLLVVADEEDAKNSLALWRTIKRNLGDEVWLTYEYGGVTHTNFATIGKDIKTFTLDIAVMKTNGVACAEEWKVKRDIQATIERYAQANIQIIANRLPDFPAPQIIATNLNGWTMRTGTGHNLALTDESRAVFDTAKCGSPNYCMVYVPSLRGDSTTNVIGGSSIAFYAYKQANDAPYLGNVFVPVLTHGDFPFTPAHELGHSFGISNHVSQAWNVMYGTTLDNRTITGPKRFSTNQIDTIRGNVK